MMTTQIKAIGNDLRSYKVRIFTRAVEQTKDLDKANLILHGDYIGEDSIEEKLDKLVSLYDLTHKEYVVIRNMIYNVGKM